MLIDEHPDSINDAACAVQMVDQSATSAQIIDIPASFHNCACGFSFAERPFRNPSLDRGKRIKVPDRNQLIGLSYGTAAPVLWSM